MPFTLYIKQHKSRCSYIIEEISSHGTNFKDPIKGNASNFGTRCHILRLLLKTKQSVKADAFFNHDQGNFITWCQIFRLALKAMLRILAQGVTF